MLWPWIEVKQHLFVFHINFYASLRYTWIHQLFLSRQNIWHNHLVIILPFNDMYLLLTATKRKQLSTCSLLWNTRESSVFVVLLYHFVVYQALTEWYDWEIVMSITWDGKSVVTAVWSTPNRFLRLCHRLCKFLIHFQTLIRIHLILAHSIRHIIFISIFTHHFNRDRHITAWGFYYAFAFHFEYDIAENGCFPLTLNLLQMLHIMIKRAHSLTILCLLWYWALCKIVYKPTFDNWVSVNVKYVLLYLILSEHTFGVLFAKVFVHLIV